MKYFTREFSGAAQPPFPLATAFPPYAPNQQRRRARDPQTLTLRALKRPC
jgi:hypothetical protein